VWNILNVKFHKPATLAPNWAVMVVRDGPPGRFPRQGGLTDPLLTELVQGFKAKLVQAGLAVPIDPRPFYTEPLPELDADPGRAISLALIRATFVRILDRLNYKPCFLLVLLAKKDNFIYPGVKRIGDVELGVNTVCMLLLPRQALALDVRKRDQYYSNVALKVVSFLPSFAVTST
jgi:eukaryotic translation initiation factor 2C